MKTGPLGFLLLHLVATTGGLGQCLDPVYKEDFVTLKCSRETKLAVCALYVYCLGEDEHVESNSMMNRSSTIDPEVKNLTCSTTVDLLLDLPPTCRVQHFQVAVYLDGSKSGRTKHVFAGCYYGHFGAKCLQPCNCKRHCSRDGTCRGGCLPGWRGKDCQQTGTGTGLQATGSHGTGPQPTGLQTGPQPTGLQTGPQTTVPQQSVLDIGRISEQGQGRSNSNNKNSGGLSKTNTGLIATAGVFMVVVVAVIAVVTVKKMTSSKKHPKTPPQQAEVTATSGPRSPVIRIPASGNLSPVPSPVDRASTETLVSFSRDSPFELREAVDLFDELYSYKQAEEENQSEPNVEKSRSSNKERGV